MDKGTSVPVGTRPRSHAFPLGLQYAKQKICRQNGKNDSEIMISYGHSYRV